MFPSQREFVYPYDYNSQTKFVIINQDKSKEKTNDMFT